MLQCPICQKELKIQGKSYVCQNKHNFDISKNGYVNLLLKQSTKSFGDSIEMVEARHLFFSYDYYLPLKEKLCTLLTGLPINNLLDSGCGEGYYTNYLYQNLTFLKDLFAVDISRYAIKTAAKSKTGVHYIVASNQRLPFLDKSLDAVLNIFSPIALSEYIRILKEDGYLITVTSGPKHLFELKQILYEKPFENSVQSLTSSDLIIKNEIPIRFQFELNTRESIQALFQMTPYYYRTSLEDKNKLIDFSALTLTADFIVHIYLKKSNRLK